MMPAAAIFKPLTRRMCAIVRNCLIFLRWVQPTAWPDILLADPDAP
jgi:hypothetical protein